MPRVVGSVVLLCVLGAALAAAAPSPSSTASRPLRTGFVIVEDPEAVTSRIRAAGGTLVRIPVEWPAVVSQRPATVALARDPEYRGYRWAAVDHEIAVIKRAGLEPILSIAGAPEWAQQDGERLNGGAFRPNAQRFADFAYAAATRYSGRTAGQRRVRYWQAWNEPNLTQFLNPQVQGGRLVSPAWYRSMVNAFAGAVKSVRPDNFVIAGGLAPFECHGKPRSCGSAPFAFMRSMLCLSRALKPTCSTPSRFDAWTHHPYTSGGPTRQAFRRDDASLGDLPEMRGILAAAYGRKLIAAPRKPEFWVTEFSWDTKPPDKGGVPAALHARWVAEALYRMWSAGVSAVTWWTVRDHPYPQSPFQSGLWYRGKTLRADRPKPALQAFRFPFVAFPERGGVRVWGRTPTSKQARVSIERRVGPGWRRVAVLKADRFGIFSARLPMRPRGLLRALTAPGAANSARPFSLTRPKEIRVQPFGDFPVDVDKQQPHG